MDVSFSSAPAAALPRASQPDNAANQPVASATQRAAEVSPVAQAQERQPLEQAVSKIESFVQGISRDLDFTLDDSSGRMVVKVTDRASGDVVRQMPTEDALRLAESLDEARSLLFKTQA